MVALPAADLTFVVAVIVPLVLGFLVGVIVKAALKIGIAIAVIIIILIALGAISPDQVIKPVLSLIASGSTLTNKVNELVGYLPYSSIAFLIGLAVGFFK